MKTVLTIAGSDPSGGAGIQADIKTMTGFGVYSMSIITALTAQNTLGVQEIFSIPGGFFVNQLESVLSDIVPDAVKIGMIPTSEHARMISEAIDKYCLKNIVIDPVMVSTSGKTLVEDDTIMTARECLFSKAILLTPNISEAEVLSDMQILCDDDCRKNTETSARRIGKELGCSVLVKGGHRSCDSSDLLYNYGKDSQFTWFEEKKIESSNNHGTGCTLSSGIASCLAKGISIEESVRLAKNFITGALDDKLDIGKGNGPINHMWRNRI
ncbi:bifunctional hydroxymethylpyrimidine kinase/phosphomethylpyrimidine kinase [Eubacteriales bacterium KG127]